MKLLDRILGRNKTQEMPQPDDRHRMLSSTPPISAEQARVNREVMEAQMAESHAKLEDSNRSV